MIGDLIRAARAIRGWSQDALAACAGVTAHTIVNVERGAHAPSPKTAARLGRVLGIDPALVLGLPAWEDATRAQRIRILRTRKGWTFQQCREQSGVSSPTLADWERGVHLPKTALLDCLTMALCGRTAEVLEGNDPGWCHE